MVWSRATLVIRWAPIQISNRCGQTSTEVEADHRAAGEEASRGRDTRTFLRTWAALGLWSRGHGGTLEDKTRFLLLSLPSSLIQSNHAPYLTG